MPNDLEKPTIIEQTIQNPPDSEKNEEVEISKYAYLKSIHRIGHDFSKEFINFLQKYGVIGLAIGVVVGQAVNKLVQSIVDNLVSPFVGLLLPKSVGNKLADLSFEGIRYGAFISDILQFIILMLIIFVVIRFVIIRILSEEERKKLNM